MSLPMLARGIMSTLFADAVWEGKTFGPALIKLLDDLYGPDENRTAEVMVPVDSSCIVAIGYSIPGVIHVQFKRGGKSPEPYDYFMGSEEVFMAFLTAPSKGSFFNQHIR